MSVLTRLRVLLFALAILAGGFAALAPQAAQEVEASHAGLITIKGKVTYAGSGTSGFRVYLYNSSGTLVRSVATDAYGNYAISAGRGHTFYLQAHATFGSKCQPYGAGIWVYTVYTNLFTVGGSWPSTVTGWNLPVVLTYQC